MARKSKNLSQEEIDELVTTPPQNENIEIDRNKITLLSQDDIDELLKAVGDSIDEEEKSGVRKCLLKILEAMGEYSHCQSDISYLSPDQSLLSDGSGYEEETWPEEVLNENHDKIYENFEKMRKIPGRILRLKRELKKLFDEESLTPVQVKFANKVLVNIAKSLIENYGLSYHLERFPHKELEEVINIHLDYMVSLKKLFLFLEKAENNPLFSKEELREKWWTEKRENTLAFLKDIGSTEAYENEEVATLGTLGNFSELSTEFDEKACTRWDFFFEGGKSALPYTDYYLDSLFADKKKVFGLTRDEMYSLCSMPYLICHGGRRGTKEFINRIEKQVTREIEYGNEPDDFDDNGFLVEDGMLISCGKNITVVKIPFGVKGISSTAFVGCDKLSSIYMPSSVKKIGSFAFEGCKASEIYFEGSEREWNSVEKGYGWNFRILPPVVHCTDGDCDISFFISNNELVRCAEKVRTVSIPENVTAIGQAAFIDCSLLEKIVLPKNIKKTGIAVFANCASLKEIIFPEGLEIIKEAFFGGCDSLESIVIPEGVKKIARNAFISCLKLKSVTLPESLVEIGQDAFRFCSNLESLFIPKNVTAIKREAFYSCGMPLGIKVAEENEHFCSVDGILYSKDKKQLIFCPNEHPAKDFKIPETTEKICRNAFAHCKNLESVYIPATVKEIGEDVFDSCEELKSVFLEEGIEKIPMAAFIRCKKLSSIILTSSVKEIGSLVFYNCDSLKEIRFAGTLSEWNSVKRDDHYESNLPVNKVICRDGTGIFTTEDETEALLEEADELLADVNKDLSKDGKKGNGKNR